MKKPFVRQPLESLKWLNMNVKSTRGKKEPELQLKLKRCAEDLKLNPCHQATSTESNPKTTQSGGTKVTVSGLELEQEQELLHGKTTRLSASTSKTILSGNGSLDTLTNGSILVIEPETLWL